MLFYMSSFLHLQIGLIEGEFRVLGRATVRLSWLRSDLGLRFHWWRLALAFRQNELHLVRLHLRYRLRLLLQQLLLLLHVDVALEQLLVLLFSRRKVEVCIDQLVRVVRCVQLVEISFRCAVLQIALVRDGCGGEGRI